MLTSPAWAQATGTTVPAASVSAPEQAVPPVEEERPDFQPLRPAEPDDKATAVEVSPAAPAPAAAPPSRMPPPLAPVAPPPPPPSTAAAEFSWPLWSLPLAAVLGALLAMLAGALTVRALRRSEQVERRRAVAASLAAELETRRLAFESVPLPPNAEAGVSFVSSVISMAGIDCAFRNAQGALFLLPPPLVANISVHYAAVQRVADFVKGQSLASAVRMLQANRLGGHPCPDSGAMREAHVELAAAFRGLDKVILSLRAKQR